MVNIGTALGGLSGVYPAYTKSLEDTYQNQQSAEQLQGTSALGRAMPDIARFLQMMSVQGVPGVSGIAPGAGQPPMAAGAAPGGPPGARPGPPMPPGPQYAQGPPVNPNNPDLDPGNQLPPIPMAGGSPPAPPVGPGAPPSPSPVGPPGPPARPQMPSPQGGGFTGGMGGTGPALDLQTIIQAVTRNNPGAPPGVIARAVNSAIPLMNAQAQMEWRQMQAELRMQQQQMQFLLGTGRLGEQAAGREQRGALGLESINVRRAELGLPPLKSLDDLQQPGAPAAGAPGAPAPAAPGAPGAPGAPPGPPPGTGGAGAIADRIARGVDPPVMTGLGKEGKTVRNILATAYPNFNLAQAELEWKAANKMTMSLNGPQQTQWRATAESAIETAHDVLELGRKLQLNHISPINKLALERLVQMEPGSERGRLAQQYLTKGATLFGEMARLEAGGYAPTQDAWEVAKQTFGTDFAFARLESALTALPDIIQYRLNAVNKISGGQFGRANPYMGTPGTPGTPRTPQAPGTTPPLAPGQIQLKPGVRMTLPTPQSQPFEPFAD